MIEARSEIRPEIRNAMVKGGIVEAIVLVAGVAAYFFTGNWIWAAGAAVLGAATMVFFLVQAGLFDTRHD